MFFIYKEISQNLGQNHFKEKKGFETRVSMVLVKTMVFIHFCVKRKKPNLTSLGKGFENGID